MYEPSYIQLNSRSRIQLNKASLILMNLVEF